MEGMGFVPGTRMRVVTVHNGNVIVNLRETRVAIGKEIADKIIVSSK
ncbi:ferrous iron transport protein A [[Clostridium] symbiosum]|nr:ferrous iron transport protein A [[Clostridium] symbiosum]